MATLKDEVGSTLGRQGVNTMQKTSISMHDQAPKPVAVTNLIAPRPGATSEHCPVAAHHQEHGRKSVALAFRQLHYRIDTYYFPVSRSKRWSWTSPFSAQATSASPSASGASAGV